MEEAKPVSKVQPWLPTATNGKQGMAMPLSHVHEDDPAPSRQTSSKQFLLLTAASVATKAP